MTEFSTGATIDVTVSSSSLRTARDEIESELGDVQVDASSATGGGGGSRMAGRERAMGRQLDTTRNDHLNEIGSNWTDNLELNRERNDLLRQLVDVAEKDAQSSRGGRGMLGGMGAGMLGLAAGGIGLGAMILGDLGSKLSDALPDLNPGDVVDSVEVAVGDVINSAASIGAADTIAEMATLSPGVMIAEQAMVTASDVVDTAASIGPSDVIEAAASVSPTDVISDLAAITPAVLIAEQAAVTASDVIDTSVVIEPADVIDAAVDFSPGDVVTGTVSPSDILDHVFESSSTPEDSPTGDGGVGMEEIVGIGAVGGAGGLLGKTLVDALRGGGAAAGRGAAGLGTPVFTEDMFLDSDETASNRERARDATPGFMDPLFPEDPFWDGGNSESGQADLSMPDAGETFNDVTQTFDNTVEVNADLSDLEREVSNGVGELERRVNDLENALSR